MRKGSEDIIGEFGYFNVYVCARKGLWIGIFTRYLGTRCGSRLLVGICIVWATWGSDITGDLGSCIRYGIQFGMEDGTR